MQTTVRKTGERVNVLVEGPDLSADVEVKPHEEGVEVTIGGGGIRVAVGIYRESALWLALGILAALEGDEKAARIRAIVEEPDPVPASAETVDAG